MKASAALRKEADTGECWRGFRPGDWQNSINVRDFIVRNVTPFSGNEEFLAGPSQRTKAVWTKLEPFFADERKKTKGKRCYGASGETAVKSSLRSTSN
jgi:formate C-acetyltransferase